MVFFGSVPDPHQAVPLSGMNIGFSHEHLEDITHNGTAVVMHKTVILFKPSCPMLTCALSRRRSSLLALTPPPV